MSKHTHQQPASLGPLMISIEGLSLTPEDIQILKHPACAGVIIFSRNVESLEQVSELNQAIKQVNPSLLIAVDQEGGLVQRIKQPLTVLPGMSSLGRLYSQSPERGLQLAQDLGWLLASELATLGFDFSFTPVVDINQADNPIIADRAFDKKSDVVAKLSLALKQGLNSAGMPAVAKHFPGHGAVKLDSHLTMPIDERDYKSIDSQDLEPYRALVENNLEAIMTSHILYNNIDQHITTYSKFWLQDILREKLGFTGLVVSDDLNMAGAGIDYNNNRSEELSKKYLSYTQRAAMAHQAGCELLLLCNNRPAVLEVLENWNTINWQSTDSYQRRLNALRYKCTDKDTSTSNTKLHNLKNTDKWQQVVESLNVLYTNNKETYITQ